MKAVWNNIVIAEADKADLIYIERNWYFPPDSIKKEYFTHSETKTSCFWKGEASYYTVTADGSENKDAAWYYAEPLSGSKEKIGNDFTNHVAFWRGVTVTE